MISDGFVFFFSVFDKKHFYEIEFHKNVKYNKTHKGGRV